MMMMAESFLRWLYCVCMFQCQKRITVKFQCIAHLLPPGPNPVAARFHFAGGTADEMAGHSEWWRRQDMVGGSVGGVHCEEEEEFGNERKSQRKSEHFPR